MEYRYRTDLHLHSTASDGALSPERLVQRAVQAGLNVLALTDHETLAGLPAAAYASKNAGVRFIPGVEINTAGEDEMHVLLYFVNETMDELVETLSRINRDRQERGQKFIERFKQLGISLTEQDFKIPPGVFCNRPHVAQALVRLGYVSSIKEAFDRYLAVGKPGYIARTRLETADIVNMARRNGAVPVLAHPGLVRKQALVSIEALKGLQSSGLMGIEAYHSMHSPSQCRDWETLARGMGLLVTGGSDYHRDDDQHGPIGCMLGKWAAAHQDTAALLEVGSGLSKGIA